jgi:PAS domain S-box-containing protein
LPLISDWVEKERVAELNLQAGRKAKASSAYASACLYLAAGMDILTEAAWRNCYDLTLELYLERAECEILCSNLELAAALIDELLLKASSKVERAEACRLRMLLELKRGDFAPAVRTALECLRTFKLELPEHPTSEQVRAEYDEVYRALGERSIVNLVDLPLTADPEMRVVMKLFNALAEVAYHSDSELFQMIACCMVKLTLRHGTTEFSTIAYAALGIILGPDFHLFRDGEDFARLSVAVSERHGYAAPRAGAHFLMQMAVLWTRPIENALPCLEAAARSARETGEMVYACYTGQHRLTNLMARGDPLDEIWRESVAALDFVRKYKFGQVVILSIQDFVQSLRGQTRGANRIDGAALEARVLRSGVAVVACFHWILQLQRHFLLGDPDMALEFAAKANPLLWSVRHNIQSVDYCLYHSLALAAVIPTAPPGRRTELREAFTSNLRSLQRWAESCPPSFSHKYELVAAEAARLEGREIGAMRLYEQAIRAACANGFIHDEAIAYEVAARFYAAHGFDKMADAYFLQARSRYVRWGAEAKVHQLDQQYPQLQQERLVAGSKSTIAVRVEHLDLATVIKVSQSVSGELVLEKLIDRLMRAAIEHAGAQRGLLINPRNDELRIEAEATTRGEDLTVNLGGSANSALALPESLVKYVMQTQKAVILDNALSKSAFSADPYIAGRRPRSVLCLPLITQGKLIGILYLENNLTPHVFNSGRVTVLKVLASQAAISLENTRLYRDLAEREAKIRRLVDATIIGIFIWDYDGRILEANDAFLRMVGHDREDLASGRIRWTDLTPPDWRECNDLRIETHKSSGRFPPFEKEYTRKDGTRVPVLIGEATFEEGGNQGVAFVLDLTERKRAEEALREEQERLRQLESELAHLNRRSMMGELAASLVHEIAQPCASARNNARAALNFLDEQPPDLGEVRDALGCILGDADRAGAIIDRIRDHIKKKRPQKTRFDLNEAINEVIGLARGAITKNGVSVDTHLAEGALPVEGDRVQLQQVLLNLMLNAVEAVGSVQGLRKLSISTLQIQTNGVLVAVRDTGPGVDVEHLAHVFEAFYTTKSSGVGMGLSICRSIIDAHGGRLWAEANEPRGAVFQFTLPSAERTRELSSGGSPEWTATR